MLLTLRVVEYIFINITSAWNFLFFVGLGLTYEKSSEETNIDCWRNIEVEF